MLLFALGLLCNDVLEFRWEQLRVAGVLQRIALCYGVAAVFSMHASSRGLVAALAVILLGYWALLASVAAPGKAAGDYSIEGNLPGWVDRHYLPGKIVEAYYGYGDNEGLLSNIPALATVLLGVLAGRWLRSDRRPWEKVAGLAAAGTAAMSVGAVWGLRFPIIKNLWTSSYVLVAGGLSLVLLAVFYALVDVLQFRRSAFSVLRGDRGQRDHDLRQLAGSSIFAHCAGEFFLGGTSTGSPSCLSPAGFREVLPGGGSACRRVVIRASAVSQADLPPGLTRDCPPGMDDELVNLP